MRHFRSGLRLAALAGALAAAPAAAKPIAWTNCADLPGFAERTPAEQARLRCGALDVPLDHARPEGRAITMRFAVRSAERPASRPPVLVLSGGGGGSMRQAAGSFAEPYPTDRDLIFVDTRGKDGSGLGLCDATRRAQVAALARDLNGEALRAAFFEPLRACRAALVAAGVPLDVYGAFRIVQDLEQLRRALNHRRMLLWGISHGTVVANHYAAMHPARVEAMLLDGPYPPDPTANAPTLGFREGLAGAAAACRGQPICGPARDRLTEAYERAYAALAREPMALDVPGFGPLLLNADDFTLLVQNALYPGVQRAVSPDTTPHAIAPALIAAVEARDATLASRIAAGPMRPLASGPHAAVFVTGECADRTRYHDRGPAPFTGVELIDLGTVCPWWNARTTEPARMPTGRGIPALVLTGSTDPITPPGYVAATVRRLGAGARMLIVPGAGHGTVRSTPCGRAAAAAFFADPARAAPPACS